LLVVENAHRMAAREVATYGVATREAGPPRDQHPHGACLVPWPRGAVKPSGGGDVAALSELFLSVITQYGETIPIMPQRPHLPLGADDDRRAEEPQEWGCASRSFERLRHADSADHAVEHHRPEELRAHPGHAEAVDEKRTFDLGRTILHELPRLTLEALLRGEEAAGENVDAPGRRVVDDDQFSSDAAELTQ